MATVCWGHSVVSHLAVLFVEKILFFKKKKRYYLMVKMTGKMVKDREAWRAAVHGIAKSRTRLSN